MPEAIRPLMSFTGSLLKIHILGSPLEIPILGVGTERLVFLSGASRDAGARPVWRGCSCVPRAWHSGPERRGASGNVLSAGIGLIRRGRLLRPLPGVRVILEEVALGWSLDI